MLGSATAAQMSDHFNRLSANVIFNEDLFRDYACIMYSFYSATIWDPRCFLRGFQNRFVDSYTTEGSVE
ncbi:hypothetical protein FKM82_009790 [Ascaphus truei]